MQVKTSGKLAQRSKAKANTGIVIPKVQAGMLKDYGVDTSRRWDIVHPSELSHQSKFCPRSVYLRITEGPLVKEEFDFVRENIFAEGNSIHSKWQERLRLYTELWGDWKCLVCGYVRRDTLEPGECGSCENELWEYVEVNLHAEQEALLCGHADGGILDERALVEFKSVGEGTVRIEAPTMYKSAEGDLKALWKAINKPFKTHLNQGDIYLWICKETGLPFDKICYVYESKWNQLIKEFVVEYDERRSLKLVNQARSIQTAVETGVEPECRFPGECKECKPYDDRRSKTKRRRRTTYTPQS